MDIYIYIINIYRYHGYIYIYIYVYTYINIVPKDVCSHDSPYACLNRPSELRSVQAGSQRAQAAPWPPGWKRSASELSHVMGDRDIASRDIAGRVQMCSGGPLQPCNITPYCTLSLKPRGRGRERVTSARLSLPTKRSGWNSPARSGGARSSLNDLSLERFIRLAAPLVDSGCQRTPSLQSQQQRQRLGSPCGGRLGPVSLLMQQQRQRLGSPYCRHGDSTVRRFPLQAAIPPSPSRQRACCWRCRAGSAAGRLARGVNEHRISCVCVCVCVCARARVCVYSGWQRAPVVSMSTASRRVRRFRIWRRRGGGAVGRRRSPLGPGVTNGVIFPGKRQGGVGTFRRRSASVYEGGRPARTAGHSGSTAARFCSFRLHVKWGCWH
jgi:hypothetical protein